jgi:hypothetical protein
MTTNFKGAHNPAWNTYYISPSNSHPYCLNLLLSAFSPPPFSSNCQHFSSPPNSDADFVFYVIKKIEVILRRASWSSPPPPILHLILWWKHSVWFISSHLTNEVSSHDRSFYSISFSNATNRVSASYSEIGFRVCIRAFW